MTKTQVFKRAEFLGICVDCNAPGDGKRIYNFYTPGPKPYTFGRTIGYCSGVREAEVFLRGYEEGVHEGIKRAVTEESTK